MRTIEIDGVEQTVRLDDFVAVEAAYGGEVGIGGFNRDDYSLDDVPAMKLVTIEEDEATPTRLLTGYVGVRGLDRGPLAKVGTLRQWDVAVLDGNTLLDDEVFQTSAAKRPAETDYARISWLLTTGAFSALGITAGVVPNTNTVTMDAADYRHRGPREVLGDCAESTSKNYFIYDYDGTGWKLYYDLATGTSLSSSLTLSTVLADIDDSTCFALSRPKLTKDPSRIYSAVDYAYSSGYVLVEDTDISDEFRRREIAIGDSEVKTATGATNKANAYLARSSTEKKTFTASVHVPAANVNDIRAGQRIQIKCPHLDIAEFTWMRISRREVSPQQDAGNPSSERYTINLEFAEDLLPARFGGGTPAQEASISDGDVVGLTRYQLFKEDGSQPFGPSGVDTWTSIAPAFDFGSLGSASAGLIDQGVYGDISHPYVSASCGLLTGGTAGRATKEAWYRFQVDLADETLLGVRFDIATLDSFGQAVGADIICGVHTGADVDGVELTDKGQYTTVATITDAGGSVFVPRSLLIDNGDGYCWFVLAPGWNVPYGEFRCDGDADYVSGYAEADPSDDDMNVTATEQVAGGGGLSPWRPLVGDVDGSNHTFTLLGWSGVGVPEVRVGVVILGPGEFSYDAGALTIYIHEAPPADMAGQVAGRYDVA